MKLSTVKILEWGLIAVAFLCMALLYVKDTAVFSLLGVVSIVGCLLVNLIFWRCPKCGKWLGRDSKNFCTHCGAPLDRENED
jgi:rubrerythrin